LLSKTVIPSQMNSTKPQLQLTMHCEKPRKILKARRRLNLVHIPPVLQDFLQVGSPAETPESVAVLGALDKVFAAIKAQQKAKNATESLPAANSPMSELSINSEARSVPLPDATFFTLPNEGVLRTSSRRNNKHLRDADWLTSDSLELPGRPKKARLSIRLEKMHTELLHMRQKRIWSFSEVGDIIADLIATKSQDEKGVYRQVALPTMIHDFQLYTSYPDAQQGTFAAELENLFSHLFSQVTERTGSSYFQQDSWKSYRLDIARGDLQEFACTLYLSKFQDFSTERLQSPSTFRVTGRLCTPTHTQGFSEAPIWEFTFTPEFNLGKRFIIYSQKDHANNSAGASSSSTETPTVHHYEPQILRSLWNFLKELTSPHSKL
jgi:hypothetical protein